MSVVDDILENLQKKSMSIEEIHRNMKSLSFGYVRSSANLMIKMGLVELKGEQYCLTQIGRDQLCNVNLNGRLTQRRKITDGEIEAIIPDRKVFSAADLSEPIAKIKGKKMATCDINKLLRERAADKRIVRVSQTEQPKGHKALYIKGLEKDEWVCSHCQRILAANEFDAENWGMAGAVCTHCMVVPKRRELPSVIATPKEILEAEQVFGNTRGEVMTVMRQISNHTSHTQYLVEKVQKVEDLLTKLVDISAKNYDLFCRMEERTKPKS